MADGKMIFEMIRQMIQENTKPQIRVLAVYFDTDRNAEFGRRILRGLISEGLSYDVMLSKRAYEIYDIEVIKKDLKPEHLWIENSCKMPDDLYTDHDLIIIPACSINAAARMASCMTEGAAGEMVLNALLTGKKVILAIDGCCPDCLGSDPIYQIPEALKLKMKENLKALRDYGVTPVVMKNLRKTILKEIEKMQTGHIQTETPEAELKKAQPVENDTTGESFDGKVVSASVINGYKDGSEIRISSKAIITQMALERAKQKSVKIITI